jgi:DNA adenine methylase
LLAIIKIGGNLVAPIAYNWPMPGNKPTNEKISGFFNSGVVPFVKWPGGKSSELIKIELAMPKTQVNRYIEPFLGGGSALLALNTNIPAFANDICPELISLYMSSEETTPNLQRELLKLANFWNAVSSLEVQWSEIATSLMGENPDPAKVCKLIVKLLLPSLTDFPSEFTSEFERRLSKDLPTKLNRIAKIQVRKGRLLPHSEFTNNIEGSIRAAFYMSVRKRYNSSRTASLYNDTRVADFFFLREYCYASMFRFNSKGEFNIPYGGVSYNKKDFEVKIDRLYSTKTVSRLSNTTFFNLDFQDFLSKVKPVELDFVFVDPPYDSDFTDYDSNEFRAKDQERLAKTLSSLKSKVMIVIGDTELIRDLYKAPHWKIQEDHFTYKWTIKERNNRQKTHLTITNY